MPALLRTFVAVETSEEVRSALETVQASLRRQRVRARWVHPAGMHLTLKFLGGIAADQVPRAADALRRAADGQAGFSLTVAGIGVFPDLRRPRVVWAGLSGGMTPLAALQIRVEDELAAVGFPREERPFRAHLTIGRCSEPAAPEAMAEAVRILSGRCFGAFEVRELVLFQSELKPEGAVHTALARAGLKKNSFKC
jgi:2'-5' RNA ligase